MAVAVLVSPARAPWAWPRPRPSSWARAGRRDRHPHSRAASIWRRAHRMDVVVLDKTGTITKGEPAVTDVIGRRRPSTSRRSWPPWPAAEPQSEHPLAQAIVAAARSWSEPLTPAEPGAERGAAVRPSGAGRTRRRGRLSAIPGHGVRALVDGRPVLIGNRKLMRDYGIDVDGAGAGGGAGGSRARPPCSWPSTAPRRRHRRGRHGEGTRRRRPSPSCSAWAWQVDDAHRRQRRTARAIGRQVGVDPGPGRGAAGGQGRTTWSSCRREAGCRRHGGRRHQRRAGPGRGRRRASPSAPAPTWPSRPPTSR